MAICLTVVAAVGMAVCLTRGRSSIAQVVWLNEPTGGVCAICTVGGEDSKPFLRARLAQAAPENTPEPVLVFATGLLDASLRSCASEMTALRLAAGESPTPSRIVEARAWARGASGELRPPRPPDSMTGEELVEWWMSAGSKPWAWIDANSISLERTNYDAQAARIRRYLNSLTALNKASSVFKAGPFVSSFTVSPDMRNPAWETVKADTDDLWRLRVHFGLRAESVEDDTISLEAYLFREGGRVGVYVLWIEPAGVAVSPMALVL